MIRILLFWQILEGARLLFSFQLLDSQLHKRASVEDREGSDLLIIELPVCTCINLLVFSIYTQICTQRAHAK